MGDTHETTRALWDDAAATFDNEPDHGLRDPEARDAWSRLLADLLPAANGRVLDAGCGTGSLSLLMARLGHDVTGIDLSPRMVARAGQKSVDAGTPVRLAVGDAARPEFPPGTFRAVVCRHVLWTLPDPAAVLRRWADLLAPSGHLVLIEGFWHTGAGLRSAQVLEAMPPRMRDVTVRDLSADTRLWGGPVNDERYVVSARRG